MYLQAAVAEDVEPKAKSAKVQIAFFVISVFLKIFLIFFVIAKVERLNVRALHGAAYNSRLPYGITQC